MGRTACTDPQWLYKGALYLYLLDGGWFVKATSRLFYPRRTWYPLYRKPVTIEPFWKGVKNLAPIMI